MTFAAAGRTMTQRFVGAVALYAVAVIGGSLLIDAFDPAPVQTLTREDGAATLAAFRLAEMALQLADTIRSRSQSSIFASCSGRPRWLRKTWRSLKRRSRSPVESVCEEAESMSHETATGPCS